MRTQAAPKSRAGEENVERLRVFLADDHHAVREGLKALLQREGINVVGEAADGRGAVSEVLRLDPPADVVVLDFAMPGMNGVDAAREITAATPEAGLILLSGLTDTR